MNATSILGSFSIDDIPTTLDACVCYCSPSTDLRQHTLWMGPVQNMPPSGKWLGLPGSFRSPGSKLWIWTCAGSKGPRLGSSKTSSQKLQNVPCWMRPARSLNIPVMNRTSHDHRRAILSELRCGSLTPLASMSPKEPLKSQIEVGFDTESIALVNGSTSSGKNQGISSEKIAYITGEKSGSWLGIPLPGLAASVVPLPQGRPAATAPTSKPLARRNCRRDDW